MVIQPCHQRHVFPLPVPTGPWQWRQRWADLLFLHWPVAHAAIQKHLPVDLELDTWDDHPWVSLVAFRLEKTRMRRLPFLSCADNLIELNFRTYVRYRDEPAIYFLSIHADKRLAVALARWLTPLPYVRARMSYEKDDNDYHFHCADGLDVRFTPRPLATSAPPESLTAWLLERYGLYAATPRRGLLRTVVQHEAWRVQEVDLNLAHNRIGEPFGLSLPGPPQAAHFSPGMDALLWPFEHMV